MTPEHDRARPGGVIGIDYGKLVEDAWSLHKYRCGTSTCIAFKNGAEWQARASLAQPASVPAPLPAPEYSHCDADYSVGHGVGYVQGWNAYREAMLAAAPQAPQPAQADNKWRELALKFDGQRMAALAHLRTLLAHPAEHAEAVRKFLAEPPQAAPQPAQAVPQLTGCNCRWDGETQVQWCELHLAHKGAIHDWAERAKTAEAKLAAPQPEAQPYEHSKAISEGARNAAADAYFAARAWMMDTAANRRLFEAGFDRGWDAAPSAQAPQPEAQPSMTPEQVRDGIADWIETNVNHREFWTPEVADLIRSIEIRPEAYVHRAAPSAQAEPTTAMGHVYKDAAQRMDAFYQAFNGKQAEHTQHCASRGGTGAECDCEAQAEQGGK